MTTQNLPPPVSCCSLTLPGFQPKHFKAEDPVEGLKFDYKVRGGVFKGTDGLTVLRMLGIEISGTAPSQSGC